MRLIFLALFACYLFAVMLSLVLFFADNDAMRCVPAILVTLPWSLVWVALMQAGIGTGASLSLLVIAVVSSGVLNAWILFWVAKQFPKKGATVSSGAISREPKGKDTSSREW